MSNLGFHWVLRRIETTAGFTCERFFWEGGLKTPIRSLESGRLPQDFHLLVFSVSFELDFPAVLDFLLKAGLPPHATERDARYPLVVAGGAALQINPEPLAPFLDIILLGEGEEILPLFLEKYLVAGDRHRLFQDLVGLPFAYIPSSMDVEYDPGGGVQRRVWRPPGPATAFPPIVRCPPLPAARLAAAGPPFNNILSPHTEFASTLLVEIARGCPMGCRYCWAGFRYLPHRAFPGERILELARHARPHTDRIGLVSTAVCQHPDIHHLLAALQQMRFSIGLASLRLSDIDADILQMIAHSGKESVTLAPETGSEPLRRTINKSFSNIEILEKVQLVYASGIHRLKLYFMTGLPGETEADVEDSLSLIRRILAIRRESLPSAHRLSISVTPFIPKPNTPFQFAPLAPPALLKRNMRRFQRELGGSSEIEVHLGSVRDALLQYHLSMGTRRTGELLLAVASGQLSIRDLPAADTPWSDQPGTGPPPWSVLDWGLRWDYLRQEWSAAQKGTVTAPCPGTPDCRRCGICSPESTVSLMDEKSKS
ncbi:MAG: radical SAM protein [Acidobacteria bacterium]|nr:radical SAM protein [Acidobacteriota bacterium]